MAKCLSCGTRFDVSVARADYEEYGEEYADDDYDENICTGCAMPELESVISVGRALLMMKDDDDYYDKDDTI